MSNFYTSVERFGNTILWRGFQNGTRFERKVKYKPTMYCLTDDKNSSFRSLTTGRALAPVSMDSMRHAKEWVEQYKDVGGFEIADVDGGTLDLPYTTGDSDAQVVSTQIYDTFIRTVISQG